MPALKKHLDIPVIGIGAGNDCDGQVRVTADILGLSISQPPFANLYFQAANSVSMPKGMDQSTHQYQVNPPRKHLNQNLIVICILRIT